MTQQNVAPLVGAWIEILKNDDKGLWETVAPLVGAWIEILLYKFNINHIPVAPLVGAWIEIHFVIKMLTLYVSLLSWERGLKFIFVPPCNPLFSVAPLVGAWIEIPNCEQIVNICKQSLLSWERGLKSPWGSK